jgi:hypothetical protein
LHSTFLLLSVVGGSCWSDITTSITISITIGHAAAVAYIQAGLGVGLPCNYFTVDLWTGENGELFPSDEDQCLRRQEEADAHPHTSAAHELCCSMLVELREAKRL